VRHPTPARAAGLALRLLALTSGLGARRRLRIPFRSEPPFGGVAQLGEHLLCKQGVGGSTPLTSTSWACGRA
jgi:hypothetical protein